MYAIVYYYSWLSHKALRLGQSAILDLCKTKICHTMWHHVPCVTHATSVTSRNCFTTTPKVHPMLLASHSSTPFASNNLGSDTTVVTSQGNSPPHYIRCIGLQVVDNVESSLSISPMLTSSSPPSSSSAPIISPRSTAIWWVNFARRFSGWHPDVRLGQKNKSIIFLW